MTTMGKIRYLAGSGQPFRLHLADARVLEVKGRDWISIHPSGNQASTYHPSFLRSYYHVNESAHDDINADHENSRNRNH